MKSSQVLHAVVLLFAPLSDAFAQERLRLPSVPTVVGKSAPVQRPAAQPSITFRDGRLSAKINNQSLEWSLGQISRQTGVMIVCASGLAKERLNAEFQGLPLDEALRLILKDYDLFSFYGGQHGKAAALRAIWVYPKGGGQGLIPLAPSAFTTESAPSLNLSDPDPGARARALDLVVERDGQQSLEAVLHAVHDGDEMVRIRALDIALSSGVLLPQDVLSDLVRYDASPAVRLLALGAVADLSLQDSKARASLEYALNDPDPQVREQAQQVLLELDARPGLSDNTAPRR